MMDYYLLADLAARLGCQLALAGAETFRVEDTVRRILRTYGVECEVFAIPNSLTVSFEATNGKPLTIMKRIGYHGNDLEALEQLNALSRRISREKPTEEEASEWLRQTMARCRVYRPAVAYLGSFLGGLGFALVFGSSLRDCLWAGLMGMIIGFVNRFLDRFEANPFFSTILASFLMAVPAYVAAGLGWLDNPDAAIIGALMILVPGLLITNSMRDIIYGDTNSGVVRIVQVFLSAFAIALGTAAAWRVTAPIYGIGGGVGVAGVARVGAGAGGVRGVLWLLHPVQYPWPLDGAVRAGRNGHMDDLSAVPGAGAGRVHHEPVRHPVCRAVCRGDGPCAPLPRDAVSGPRDFPAAAGRRGVLHHELGPTGRDARRPAQRSGNGGHRRFAGGGYPAGVHGFPGVDGVPVPPGKTGAYLIKIGGIFQKLSLTSLTKSCYTEQKE